MKTNHKKIQVARILKGALLFTVLAVSTACSGGGGGQSISTPTVVQSNLKIDLCDEVNGWESDCRFLGMKYLKLNPNEVTPLTEKYGRGRGRSRGGREV